MYKLLNEEEKFYKDYQWCLEPMPPWGELGQRFSEELDRWRQYAGGWQERESALNCWLMACALAQVVNDHLTRGTPPAFPAGRSRLMGALAILATGTGEEILHLRNRTVDRVMLERACRWRELLLILSKCIVSDVPASSDDKGMIREKASSLLEERYPACIRRARIQIPAAFRSQDLTHFDVLRLLQQYVDSNADFDTSLLIVGLRTTGDYFAPLTQVYLESKGFASVDFVTLRPGHCLSYGEHRCIARHAAGGSRFLIIDESAQSGDAVKEALAALRRYGIDNRRVDIAFPVYPAHTRWKQNLRTPELSGTRIYTLSWSYWEMVVRMKPENVRRILKEYYDAQEQFLVSIEESQKGKHLDERFGRPERIGWRLKQVYRLRIWDRRGKEHYEDVLVKSVGWGWFGYHAYIAADRLSKYVPPLLGLRSGLLFMRWIDGKTADNAGVDMRQIIPEALNYIFERIDKLPLPEDMTFKEYSQRYYGGELLCRILSRAYGTCLSRIIRPLIRRVLRRYATPYPTAIDGKMAPREWVYEGGWFWKTDFEHHGFGQKQLNIADPVFDLASFIFEFRLGQKEIDDAIACYIERTNDAQVKDKVMLYIWLIAHHNIASVREYLSEPYRYKWSLRENTKYLDDRAYICRFSVEYLASLIKWPRKRNQMNGCWLLDIDRMMENRIWAFPAMALKGARRLAQFKRQGYRVFIQSSRSLPEVKNYCDCFDLEGGAAEYGSVIWDRSERREIVLVPPIVSEQIRQLQSLLLDYPNVYVDSNARYTVKAFHYRDGGTVPVDTGLIENIVVSNHLNHLKIMHQEAETVVLSSSIAAARAEQLLRAAVQYPVMPLQERSKKRESLSSLFPVGIFKKSVRHQPRQTLSPASGERLHAGDQGMRWREERDGQRHLLLAVMGSVDRPLWVQLLALIGTHDVL